ncbi:MAG: LacI family DNA-binding transcriptional regulator [Lachnospiraceae bacterium]|nr:LacI family DNA-binding transcriptional regulator [Lachnospiraceae bacterium]
MSLKAIADLAGVSASTVSRVLNDPDYRCKDQATRDRIWEAAMKLNYKPNIAARNLRLGSNVSVPDSFYINVLVTRMDDSGADPFFTEILHSVETEIHKNMCILSKVWYISLFSDDKKCQTTDISSMVDELYEQSKGRCDGLIIIGKCNIKALKELHKRYNNIVSVNRNSTNHEIDEVICDGQKIATIATEYLTTLGHTRIGYIGACHNEARYKGFINVLQKHELDIDPEYITETNQTEVEGYDAMEKFVGMDEPPTAFYCANDITAVGMIKYINRHKSSYHPSIIASDGIELAGYITPMLTTVSLPKYEMGRFATQLLIDRIKGGHKSATKMELEGKLVIRNSCYNVKDGDWT